MTDNTKVNNIQEKLLQAMDIINAQALSNVSYDKTIICSIENADKSKEGQYEVSDGAKIFTAYSSDTGLKVKDTVYVTIPEGKFENQKMIIGKKTSKEEKPFVFKTPFDNFFAMTENLAATAQPAGLIANNGYDVSKPTEQQKEQILLFPNVDDNNGILDVSNEGIIKYTRLGIRADFRAWIKEAVKGNYGLIIELITTKPNVAKDEAQSLKGTYAYVLDSSIMYGNPYNFETWYTQEVVLDLSKQDIGQVTGIKISFYQKKNFYDDQGILLPYKNMLPNLFVQNVSVQFGYDASQFTEDYVEIYTADKYTYNRLIDNNTKNLKMRWVHIRDGEPFDMVNKSQNQNDVDCIVRWYKYRVGAAAADKYSSVYWEKIGESSKNSEGGLEFTLAFNPDLSLQQERVKAIVLLGTEVEGSYIPYRSNELYFENVENMPPSKDSWAIMNALTIVTDDDTNGNYMYYRQDNSLEDSELSKVVRTLSPYFDFNSNGQLDPETEAITDLNHVTWNFPTENTMIKLISEGNYERINLIPYEKDEYYIQSTNEDGTIEYIISEEESIQLNKKYYKKDGENYIEIKNFYKPNTYYLYKYNQCLSGSSFDINKDYYKIKTENGKEIYTIFKNLTINDFSGNEIPFSLTKNQIFVRQQQYVDLYRNKIQEYASRVYDLFFYEPEFKDAVVGEDTEFYQAKNDLWSLTDFSAIESVVE